MSETANEHPEAGSETSRVDAEREADQRADVRAILVIFVALILGAVHFISQG